MQQTDFPSRFWFPECPGLFYTIVLDANGLSVHITLSSDSCRHQSQIGCGSSCEESSTIEKQSVRCFFDDPIFMHWGITVLESPGTWVPPSKTQRELNHFVWPPQTTFMPGAAQTAFPASVNNERTIEFRFPSVTMETALHELPRTVEFVLYSPPDTWRKAGKANFVIPIASSLQMIFTEQQLQNAAGTILGHQFRGQLSSSSQFTTERWNVKNQTASFSLLAHTIISVSDDYAAFFFFCDTPHPVLLHWGLDFNHQRQWNQAESLQTIQDPRQCTHYPFSDPSTVFASVPWDSTSLQTNFQFVNNQGESPIQYARILLKAPIVPKAVLFVLKERHSTTWFKNGEADFCLTVLEHEPYNAQREVYLRHIEEVRAQQDALVKKRQNAWKEALERFREIRDQRRLKNGEVRVFKSVTLANDFGDMDMIGVYDKGALEVTFLGCFQQEAILHWGVIKEAKNLRRISGLEWTCPAVEYRPDQTTVYDEAQSCETPFNKPSATTLSKFGITSDQTFLQAITLRIPATLEAAASEMDSGVSPEIEAIVCVVRNQSDGTWYKGRNNNADIILRLTSRASSAHWRGPLPEVIEDILNAEIGWSHMTLMHRYHLMNTAVKQWADDAALQSTALSFGRTWTSIFRSTTTPLHKEDNDFIVIPRDTTTEKSDTDLGDEFWSWMYVWGRFSYLGLLDWQRNYNTKPRELAHATECLTYTLADLWIQKPKYRSFIRLVLSTIARGGNQGQAIRDRILDIMHRHRIPEHNANFYEQWHQKLHNNTTPDDVAICSAVISFLKSGGQRDAYWDVLRTHGVTKERLASYERKITAEPFLVQCDLGSLIADLEHYLDILKDVHDSLDLKKAFDHSVEYLDPVAIDTIRTIVAQTTVSGLALKHDAIQKQHGWSSTDAMHNRFQKIAEARRSLLQTLTRPHQHPSAVRELLFLDYALEQQEALCLQADHLEFSAAQLAEQVKNMVIQLSGHSPSDPILHAIALDWVALSDICVRNAFGHQTPVESALLLKALADRVSLYVGQCVTFFQNQAGLKAQYMGLEIGTNQHVLDIFVDEILRGSLLFSMSVTLKRLEPLLRESASLPPWMIVSHADRVQGRLVRTDRLSHIQDQVFTEPTILLSGAVSGEEEVPNGVQAVLVRTAAESPDILSHVSVRARNAHVLLAVCFDPAITDQLSTETQPAGCVAALSLTLKRSYAYSAQNIVSYKQRRQLFSRTFCSDALEHGWVEITVPTDGSRLECKPCEEPAKALGLDAVTRFDRQHTQKELFLEEPTDQSLLSAPLSQMLVDQDEQNGDHCNLWAAMQSDFTNAIVGSKSINLTRLHQNLKDSGVKTPVAAALPFTAFTQTLRCSENAYILDALKECLNQLKEDSSTKDISTAFFTARRLVNELKCPLSLQLALKEALRRCDQEAKHWKTSSLLELYVRQGDAACWQAICGVWASAFHLRPWISLAKAGKQYCNLRMAVLIQELLPASYAFVLHSRNPMALGKNEMYGEIVPGLGETLVGNYPGRALSWTMQRNGVPEITAFPSKHYALKNGGCLLFRSDSNSEDLEGFAGAGLFESIPSQPNDTIVLNYASLSLISDVPFRQCLLERIGKLAFVIEDHFNRPMDIEGVVLKDANHIVIVQARSQM